MNGKFFVGLKELNRLRRVVLFFGFYDFFEVMAFMLDRECIMLFGLVYLDVVF